MMTDTQSLLKVLQVRWFDVEPGKTTEQEFFTLAGVPQRKIVEKNRTVYLYSGSGVVSDSAVVQDGVIVQTDVSSPALLSLTTTMVVLDEQPVNVSQSGFMRGSRSTTFQNTISQLPLIAEKEFSEYSTILPGASLSRLR